MEEVAAVRGAALDAVGDVEPDRLRQRIRERLEDGSMAPGVLTVLSARAVVAGAADGPSVDTGAVADRGAGVQLIYEGLRLTRSLSRAPPWEREDELTDGGDVAVTDAVTPGPTVGADADDADMDILVADVMVARGFYLLARTEAAGEAVAVVRSFGGDQTRRRTTGDERLDANLEADVFELAAVAGTTAAGGSVTESLRSHVEALGRTDGRLPLAESLFTDGTPAALAERI
ncbi:hypothetical protein I7X12_14235 [Halosimplex litoreum]|uniref:Uncharacterized protein n=1 Tax=Halosimplex litoreum TaxID=1198301 RepID=A0A7T3KU50_9EURY|nr:hypothetical protein [Halosimplex litoreum]QPV61904.1 hypothetical protein I7X12_14235 [Halosimplex litoreum]